MAALRSFDHYHDQTVVRLVERKQSDQAASAIVLTSVLGQYHL